MMRIVSPLIVYMTAITSFSQRANCNEASLLCRYGRKD